MSLLENEKHYTGSDLDQIFFRPMLTGPSAQELGVRILYNLPTPTTVHLWEAHQNILQKYSSGWSGGPTANRYEKRIPLSAVKAEMSFSASDYFASVYEKIIGQPDVNLQDLSGTELEKAETELFREALLENIRATMWAGDTSASGGYNTFDGFFKSINDLEDSGDLDSYSFEMNKLTPEKVVELFDALLTNTSGRLLSQRAEGHLAFFVSSYLYHLYEKWLDSKGVDIAYTECVAGRQRLAYHGIPVIDVCMDDYLPRSSFSKFTTFCMLTDRRNLVLAVNTADCPGNEVRMWYNPDEMENRQRAVFMAGCEILDEGLLSFAYGI